MLKRWFLRLFVGVCFALPMGFVAAAAAQAGPPIQTDAQNECNDCHEIIQAGWSESAHGQASSNEAFELAWQEQGSQSECLSCHTTGYDANTGTYESEGVTCKMCHYPASADHPEAVMPTDISSRLCGNCHIDTYSEWETSTHGQEDLACVRCHNPHTTALKKSDAQEICQACHNAETHFYNYTGHAKEGLLCSDCHLRVSGTQMGEGHGQRQHTFVVDISSCTGCHSDNLHYPSGNESDPAEVQAASLTLPVGKATVSSQPNPVSPLGFAVVAALVGMGSGMILAPWLEKWYRRNRQDDGAGV